jgi:hypothetical protein
METFKEMLSIGGAIASIAGFVLGFVVGAPVWQKRGMRLAQRQMQGCARGDATQSQEQKVTF